MSDQTPGDEPVTHKTPKGRSPSYPGVNLETAVRRAGDAYERLRQHKAPVKAFTDIWGYSKPTTGPATVTFAALKKYGLLEDEGSGDERLAHLTELAVAILLRPDPSQYIEQAAFTPPIHKELFARFGRDVPPDEALQYEFVAERGFTESGFRDCLKVYRETLQYADPQLEAATERPRAPQVGHLREADDELPAADDPDKQTGDGRNLRVDSSPTTPPLPAGLTSYTVPVSVGTNVYVHGEFPLSEAQWVQFLAVLSAMKPALVAHSDEPSR